MKKFLSLALLTISIASAFAQGTLQFTANLNGANEVPPNGSLATASGQFTLNGNLLDYTLGMTYAGPNTFFLPTSAGIYGPANANQTGSLIFNLGNYIQSANPPSLIYSGEFSLTPQQINDLENSLWYVNFISSTFPNGEIRGQISPVPEPSTLALLGVGLACCLGLKVGRRSKAD